MEEKSKEFEDKEWEATAGGGAVTVRVSGKKEILSVKLQEEVVDPDDIEMLEDVGVVERCTLDDCTAEQNRLEVGNRGNNAHSSGFEGDESQLRERALGLEFVGDSPARRLSGCSESSLVGVAVDFEDESVGSHFEVLAFGVPVVDKSLNLVD